MIFTLGIMQVEHLYNILSFQNKYSVLNHEDQKQSI